MSSDVNADNNQLRDGEWIFHRGLKTHVGRIAYDWYDRMGTIWARGPVDMSGSIRLFTAIDLGVSLIVAYMKDKPDVCYRRIGNTWLVGDLRSHEQVGETLESAQPTTENADGTTIS